MDESDHAQTRTTIWTGSILGPARGAAGRVNGSETDNGAEGEREHAMRAQIAEPLATHRRLSEAPVGKATPGPGVEPVPRIALTRQEACVSLGCSEEFFVEHVRPHLRVIGSDVRRALVEQSSTAESAISPDNLVPCEAATRAIGRSSQRTSPPLMVALSFGDGGAFRGG